MTTHKEELIKRLRRAFGLEGLVMTEEELLTESKGKLFRAGIELSIACSLLGSTFKEQVKGFKR